jgi:hypothetical protein
MLGNAGSIVVFGFEVNDVQGFPRFLLSPV